MNIPKPNFNSKFPTFSNALCCCFEQRIERHDCYFHADVQQTSGSIPTCDYHGQLGYCPCEGCKKYIKRSDAFEIIKKHVDMGGGNKMTNSESIKWIKAISATQSNSLNKNSLSDRKEALHIAIQALKKEEPKKPHKYIDIYETEKNGCPNCYEKSGRNEILYAGQKYCSACGQAIDWSEN